MPNTLTRQPAASAPFYQAPRLGEKEQLLQAIFTRQGGVSRAPYRSLNLGQSVGDDPAAVEANLHRVYDLLGISRQAVTYCHLTHSATVFPVSGRERGRMAGYGDGLVTDQPGLILTMNFGDCVPLLFHDPVRKVVGLAHAGWRGTVQNVAGAMVRTMVSHFHCRPRDIIALIGPSIGPCCYEVGPDVRQAAAAAFSDSETLFSNRNGERAHFDLWAANHRQLVEAGAGTVMNAGLCTACRTDEFFSHRAEKGRTGRFGVFVGLRC